MAQTRQHLWTNSQVDEIREQRDQLMEAKRAALKVADERSKENVALRQENERLLAALRTIADHSGICSDFPHSAENLQRYARHALEQTSRTEGNNDA